MKNTLLLSPIVAGLWKLHEWRLDVAARVRWIEQALDLGITSFDHADIYGGYTVEALFGEALAATPGLRRRLQIVTKCGIQLVHPNRPGHAVKAYDTSRGHVRASVDASLRALHTDHIDLLLIHRPDPLMDPDELAQTLHELQTDGKVGHVGVSNHAAAELAALHRRVPLLTNQIECSVLQMKALADGTLTQCLDLGLQPMIWSPLGGGRLFAADDEQARRVGAVLSDIGHAHGASLASVAYAWLLRHPSRPIPVTGTRRPEGLQDAVAALKLPLSRSDWFRIWQASMGHEVA